MGVEEAARAGGGSSSGRPLRLPVAPRPLRLATRTMMTTTIAMRTTVTSATRSCTTILSGASPSTPRRLLCGLTALRELRWRMGARQRPLLRGVLPSVAFPQGHRCQCCTATSPPLLLPATRRRWQMLLPPSSRQHHRAPVAAVTRPARVLRSCTRCAVRGCRPRGCGRCPVERGSSSCGHQSGAWRSRRRRCVAVIAIMV